MHPTDHMSHLDIYLLSSIILSELPPSDAKIRSGAMNCRLETRFALHFFFEKPADMRKFVICKNYAFGDLTSSLLISWVTRMFLGCKSRWVIPLLCKMWRGLSKFFAIILISLILHGLSLEIR